MSVPADFYTSRHEAGHGDSRTRAPAHGSLGTAALGPLLATLAVGGPLLLLARLEVLSRAPAFLGPAWLVVLVLAAPMTALLMNERRPVATTLRRALLIGLT